jgi:hypothetical protein
MAFTLAAHFGQDPKGFKSRYTRFEIAEMWKDYRAGDGSFAWDYLHESR